MTGLEPAAAELAMSRTLRLMNALPFEQARLPDRRWRPFVEQMTDDTKDTTFWLRL